MKFGEAANRLSGAASMLLGWRPQEFWSSTPAELAAALSSADRVADAPDPELIDSLKLRFPDA